MRSRTTHETRPPANSARVRRPPRNAAPSTARRSCCRTGALRNGPRGIRAGCDSCVGGLRLSWRTVPGSGAVARLGFETEETGRGYHSVGPRRSPRAAKAIRDSRGDRCSDTDKLTAVRKRLAAFLLSARRGRGTALVSGAGAFGHRHGRDPELPAKRGQEGKSRCEVLTRGTGPIPSAS